MKQGPDRYGRVVIIGGGISGLSTARHLIDRRPDLDVRVLDAGFRVGGAMHTVHEDGFTTECGPTGFLNRNPSTLRLVKRLGLEDEIIMGAPHNRRRYILHRGRLHSFPDRGDAVLTTRLLSPMGKARLLMEFVVPRASRGAEETVASFARRRLGREAADVLVDPIVTGIYAGDAERLSLQATLPHMAALERSGRSLLTALVKERRAARERQDSLEGGYLSFRSGFGTLVQGLSDSLGEAVETRSPVRAVRPEGRRFLVEVGGSHPRSLEADVVVSTAPPPAARKFLPSVDASIDDMLDQIRSVPVVVLALGYPRRAVRHALDGFGYLVPSQEGGSVLGVLWPSSIFPEARAPDDMVLLQVIMGGARDPEAHQHEEMTLLGRAQVQLQQALGIDDEPSYARVFRHAPGMPQYTVGHLDRLATAERWLAEHLPGLFFGGNAFRGVGINACTLDAERVADKVIGHFEAHPAREESAPDVAAVVT